MRVLLMDEFYGNRSGRQFKGMQNFIPDFLQFFCIDTRVRLNHMILVSCPEKKLLNSHL